MGCVKWMKLSYEELNDIPVYRRKELILVHNRMTKMESDEMNADPHSKSSDSYDMVNKAAQMQQQKNKNGLRN